MKAQNKVAIVTGGARGIGKQICQTLVNAGVKVVIADVLIDCGIQTAKELNETHSEQSTVAVFQSCNVCNSDEFENLFKIAIDNFGQVDILVNNAGVGGTEIWGDENDRSLSRVIDVNLKAPIDGTRLAVRHFMRMGTPGCVVSVTSMAAFTPIEFANVYASTKAGLTSFTASCATLSLRDPPIRVNAVAPSFVDTDITKDTPTKINMILQAAGIITADDVATQVIRCIEDDSLAGDTIKVIAGAPAIIHDGPKARSFGLVTEFKL
ncbi:hypothetical protein GGI07_001075 [Coemansia sp. Benny D115]|nr:hypothetical protein GGI07_001075 [Coemansia sp. Benny D115]